MKKTIFTKIIFLSAILLSLASCEDFLAEDPKGNITEAYALTEDGAEKKSFLFIKLIPICWNIYIWLEKWEVMQQLGEVILEIIGKQLLFMKMLIW